MSDIKLAAIGMCAFAILGIVGTLGMSFPSFVQIFGSLVSAVGLGGFLGCLFVLIAEL